MANTDEGDQATPTTPSDDIGRRLVDGSREALDEPRTLTLDDVAGAAGLPVDQLERLFDAAGRLRDTGYGDRDLSYAREIRQLLEVFGEKELTATARVRSRAVSQIVVSDLTIVSRALQRLEEAAAGADVDEVVNLLVAAGAHIAPTVEKLLAADYREMLLRLLDADIVGDSSRSAADGSVDLAVGFADLVGYTRLTATIDPEGLTSVLSSFEELVHERVDANGGILVSKFIGDAAMLVSGDANLLARALLEVIESDPDELEGVPRRAGFAFGSVLLRDGDYYGTAVNTAARLTDLARPGSVLVDPDTAELLGEEWRPSHTRPMRVKGLGTIQPYRLRRHEPTGDDDG